MQVSDHFRELKQPIVAHIQHPQGGKLWEKGEILQVVVDQGEDVQGGVGQWRRRRHTRRGGRGRRGGSSGEKKRWRSSSSGDGGRGGRRRRRQAGLKRMNTTARGQQYLTRGWHRRNHLQFWITGQLHVCDVAAALHPHIRWRSRAIAHRDGKARSRRSRKKKRGGGWNRHGRHVLPTKIQRMEHITQLRERDFGSTHAREVFLQLCPLCGVQPPPLRRHAQRPPHQLAELSDIAKNEKAKGQDVVPHAPRGTMVKRGKEGTRAIPRRGPHGRGGRRVVGTTVAMRDRRSGAGGPRR